MHREIIDRLFQADVCNSKGLCNVYGEIEMSRNHGFSLIEILLTLAVIGILSGVLFPTLVNARKQATDTSVTGYVRNIAVEVESYLVDSSHNPADLDGLQCDEIPGSTVTLPNGLDECTLSVAEGAVTISATSITGSTVIADGLITYTRNW